MNSTFLCRAEEKFSPWWLFSNPRFCKVFRCSPASLTSPSCTEPARVCPLFAAQTCRFLWSNRYCRTILWRRGCTGCFFKGSFLSTCHTSWLFECLCEISWWGFVLYIRVSDFYKPVRMSTDELEKSAWFPPCKESMMNRPKLFWIVGALCLIKETWKPAFVSLNAQRRQSGELFSA